MGAACALPWLLPERWNGQTPARWLILGGLALAASLGMVRSRRWAVVPLTAILMGITFLGLRQRAQWETALPTGFQSVEGRIAAPWTLQNQRLRTQLAVTGPASLRGLSLPLTVPADGAEPPPAPGTAVRFRAELRPVPAAPVFLAERPLWRARSDEAPRRIHLATTQLMEPLGPPAPSWLLRLQVFVRRRFEALPLDPTAKDLWGALALGIPPANEAHFSVFAESGTIHILVVSGLQVTLVMVAIEALLRRLRLRGASAGAIAAGLLYCGLVGFSAPVWRGLFMGVAWALGRASGWKLPPVAGLHLALLAWLLGHPAAGVEPGFLLAWWALLGLLWGAEPLAGLLSPLLGRLALPFARIAAPWFSTLPLLALLHGGAPRWGIVANLLVLPLVAFLTPLCLLLILLPLPGLTPAAAAVLGWMGDRLVPALAGITPLATGILWPWLLLLLGWLVLAHRQALAKRTRALTVALAGGTLILVATHGTGRRPSTLSLEAVDVGQGDALLLRVPGGDATVVDTGPTPWGARRIVRVLSRRGVREPVHLVLTHPHSDHAGGWATLARLWPLASTSLPATAWDEDIWAPYAPSRRDTEGLLRGDGWRRGAAEVSVRWPPKPFALADPNMVSVVLRVRWQDRELWLMGDALAIQERDLLALGDPGPGRHRLLKAGHHGSRNASDPAWVSALDPEVVLLTAGLRNSLGHPHPETLALLSTRGLSPWVAGPCAGVRVAAAPGGWRITTGDGRQAFTPLRRSWTPATP